MGDSESSRPLIPAGSIIDKYRVDLRIGHGGYGDIYKVVDIESLLPYAMKVEMKGATKQVIGTEISMIEKLQGSPFFPQLICCGSDEIHHFYVMELLGPSLSNMRRSLPQRRYSKQSVILLSKEMLRCIEQFHEHGFIHRDIKPGNFLIRTQLDTPLCLIDFGLSKQYIDPETNEHIPFRESAGFTGTFKYASLHAHERLELSRRDDLFSWFYSIIEMAEGTLPWPGASQKSKTEESKKHTTVVQLCRMLPKQYIDIFSYIETLEYAEKPDYQRIYALIDQAINEINATINQLDWFYLDSTILESISQIPLCPGHPPYSHKSISSDTVDFSATDSSLLSDDNRCCILL